MATLTTSFLIMRWELLSAVMMFIASTFKIKCRQTSHHVMAFVFSGLGVGMSCWFVTGLLGITLSMENLHHFVAITGDAFVEMMKQTPPDWPMP